MASPRKFLPFYSRQVKHVSRNCARPICYTSDTVDDSIRTKLEDLAHSADDFADAVDAAYEEHATFTQKLDTRREVDDVARRYKELLATLSESDRMNAERTVGRKVVDLLKAAQRLPAPPAGAPVAKRQDTGFFETREGSSSRKPITIGAQAGGPRRGDAVPKYKVSGECEAYCGPCEERRTHVIIAVVDGVPAQVVCQSCGGRHKYRSGPARNKGKEMPLSAARPTFAPVIDRKAQEKKALLDALRAAESVRAYSPKERYKAGEIIEHPEHGRGKIENVLPRTLLVRFAGGLKSVRLT